MHRENSEGDMVEGRKEVMIQMILTIQSSTFMLTVRSSKGRDEEVSIFFNLRLSDLICDLNQDARYNSMESYKLKSLLD